MTQDATQELRDVLLQGLDQLGAELAQASDRQVDQWLGFISELTRWNKAYNLTAVRQPEQMVSRHLLDSLSVLPFVRGSRLLDIGSGAGLPGIPLAIARPKLQVVLLDSNGKRVRFQRHVVRRLGLDNVQPVQARAQDYQPEAPFECVVARALSSVPGLIEMAGHLIAQDGVLLAMKGRLPEDELDNVPPGFDIEAVERVQVPGSDAERHMLVLTRNKDSKNESWDA